MTVALPERMTGGQAIVRALVAEGVDTIFGIPGTHILDIYDALLDAPSIRRILPRHEQGVGFMADGYARATGRVGVMIVTGGPGLTNAATAISEAYVDSQPLLVISSHVPSRDAGLERGHLHEMKDQSAVMRNLTGWHHRIQHVAEIPSAIHEALRRLQTERPRPIHIEVPVDLLGEKAPVTLLSPETYPRATGDPAAIAQALALLRAAERPLLYAGGGVAHAGAEAELIRLAQALDAPVMTSIMGKGAIPEDHPLALGTSRRLSAATKALVESSDLVLVVGSKLGAMATEEWGLPLPKQLIHVDLDPAVIGQNYPAQVGIVGDAKAVLEQLLAQTDAVGTAKTASVSRSDTVGEAVRQKQRALWGRAPEVMRINQQLREALERDAIIAWDMTTAGYASTLYFPVYGTRQYLYPWTSGTLGFGLPVAIGAKIGRPEAQVVSVSGDGGFLFSGEELAAAVQHGISTVHVVLNDHCYTEVKRLQQNRFPGRWVDVELAPVDYVKLAEAYGARGMRCQPLELEATLREALTLSGPTVIEVPVELALGW